MAKKAITQVMEWLAQELHSADGLTTVVVDAAKVQWAVKALKRVDARDSQNQKKRKPARRRASSK